MPLVATRWNGVRDQRPDLWGRCGFAPLFGPQRFQFLVNLAEPVMRKTPHPLRRSAILRVRIVYKNRRRILGVILANAGYGFRRLLRTFHAPIPQKARPHHMWQLPVIDESASPYARVF